MSERNSNGELPQSPAIPSASAVDADPSLQDGSPEALPTAPGSPVLRGTTTDSAPDLSVETAQPGEPVAPVPAAADPVAARIPAAGPTDEALDPDELPVSPADVASAGRSCSAIIILVVVIVLVLCIGTFLRWVILG